MMMNRVTRWVLVAALVAGWGMEGRGERPPKREFRGAWMQTVFQGEYAGRTPAELRALLAGRLDTLRALGVNAVMFQVRPEGDAWYAGGLEPWSRFLTGRQGVAPGEGFDPLAFLVEECHRRGMELHAWLNPFRAGSAGGPPAAEGHVRVEHPGWVVAYGKVLWMDPGIPGCREHVCRVARDIVRRYDVDGVHVDDYFYPYPVEGVEFPDSASWRRYGLEAGWEPGERDAWRRWNVDELVRELGRTVKEVKPWVRFGVSPFGIYRNEGSDPGGSRTRGLEGYEALHADVLRWTREGWVDYCIPQLYWEIGHEAADYATLLAWWDGHAGRAQLYVGQDAGRTMRAGDLRQKLEMERGMEHAGGHCWWPAGALLGNEGGVADSLREVYQRWPALVPAYEGPGRERPRRVCRLRREGRRLTWMARVGWGEGRDAAYFVVYRFRRGERVDLEDPRCIAGVTRWSTWEMGEQVGEDGGKWRYVVTAVDRYHRESRGRGIKVGR